MLPIDLIDRNISTLHQGVTKREREQAAHELEALLRGDSLDSFHQLDIVKAFIIHFTDPSEAIRNYVAETVRENFGRLSCAKEALPRIIHELHTILSPIPVIERSESVRLAFLRLLLRLIHISTKEDTPLFQELRLYLTEVSQILCRQLTDTAPDNRIVLYKCIHKLSLAYQKATDVWTNDIVRKLTEALLENFKHNVCGVRRLAVEALKSLHLSRASEDIGQLLGPYVPTLTTDTNCGVRLAVAEMASSWLCDHIDRHVYLDFFCAILLSFMLDPEIGNEASQLFVKCGEKYEEEHRDDLRLSKEINLPPIITPYDSFLRMFAPAAYVENAEAVLPSKAHDGRLRYSLGCRCLAERTSVRSINAVLADVTGWNEGHRAKACDMLSVLLLLSEQNIIRFSSKIIENLIPFYLSYTDRTTKEKVDVIVALVFALLCPKEIIAFTESYFRLTKLTLHQLGVLLELLEKLLDVRSRLAMNALCYADAQQKFCVGHAVRLLNTILLSETVIYNDDSYVQQAFRSCAGAFSRFFVVASKDDGFVHTLQRHEDSEDSITLAELVAKLTFCVISTVRIGSMKKPSQFDCGIDGMNIYVCDEAISVLRELLRDPDAELLTEYFGCLLKLINIDVGAPDLEKRMDFFLVSLVSVIAAGYTLPPQIETRFSSLFTKLVRLTDVDKYPHKIRAPACRCINAMVACACHKVHLSDGAVIYFMNTLLGISGWRFGIRTPDCLEYVLRALTGLYRYFTPDLYEKYLSSNKEFMGTSLGRAIGNLEHDDPGCRIAALDMCRALYRHVDYITGIDILYKLVCCLEDSVPAIAIEALQVFIQMLDFYADGSNDRLPISNTEILRLLSLHVGDPIPELAAASVKALQAIIRHGSEMTRYRLRDYCRTFSEASMKSDLYQGLIEEIGDVRPVASATEEQMNTAYDAAVQRAKEVEEQELNRLLKETEVLGPMKEGVDQ
ncbi:hypothetical protein GMRT_16141 [Giardia muris]|uniref:Uncharacterized protein n=1 Tax=Giardia muris TaxID=5742 RepID=A0A4Z1SYI1_GIAMU|nr:hypothetical protein GMRT_16141 [Giardia muris]|eukprot:TNJ30736.1 hypothetical protein GMRT_16141 [Giardia muris]